MSAVRQAAITAMGALLVDAATDAADRVFYDRDEALSYIQSEDSELPCWVVTFDSESAELSADAPREYSRTAVLSADAIVSREDAPGTGIGTTLHRLLSQGEPALFDEGALLRAVEAECPSPVGQDLRRRSFVYTETQGEYDSRGLRNIGQGRLLFELVYFTEAADQPIAPGVTPFETAHVDYDLPEGEDVDATDDIELPT